MAAEDARPLCALAGIDDPGSLGLRRRDGDQLFSAFLVRRAEQVFGYIDRCPHAGWPLAGPTGRFLNREGSHILCAAHGALFRLEDGVCVSGPCAGARLTSWPVRLIGDQVFQA
jgi:nitrite reductase/ring-hydroxylating ferredoxin subunit